MKKIIGMIIIMFLMVSATEFVRPEPQNSPTIEGTWELISNYNYDEGKITDTIPLQEGYRQIKMYYNGKVMWTRYVPTDSVEWFGYGSYHTTDTTLTEILEYMSSSIRKIANDNMEWNMKLDLKPFKYSQIFTDAEGNPVSSENYKRLD